MPLDPSTPTRTVTGPAAPAPPTPAPAVAASPAPALLPLCLVVLCLVGRAWGYAHENQGCDFYGFWLVTAAVEELPLHDPYDLVEWRELGPFSIGKAATGNSERLRATAWMIYESHLKDPQVAAGGTPFLYTLLSVLDHEDYDAAHRHFLLLSLLVFTGAVFALARLAGHAPAPALALTAAALLLTALQSELRVLNANLLQVGLVAAATGLATRGEGMAPQAVAGALLALATAFKPTIALAAPLLLALRLVDRRPAQALWSAGGCLVGGLVALLAPMLYLENPSCWLSYVRYLPRLLYQGGLREGNLSLAAALRESTGLPASLPLLAGLLAAALWAVAARRRARAAPAAPTEAGRLDLLAVGLGCALTLACSPHAWIHYGIMLIPLQLALLASTSTALRALAAVALALQMLWPANDLLRSVSALAHPLLQVCALVLLLGLAIAELRRPDARSPAEKSL